MNKLIAALALLALTGCASTTSWIESHPRASLAIATSVALSIPALTNTGAHRVHVSAPEHDVTIGTPSCANGSCK